MLTLVLADRTAPVACDMWREAAGTLLNQLLQWSESLPEGAKIFLEIEDVDISEEAKEHLSPLCRLHSHQRTVVRRIGQPSSVYMLPKVNLDTRIYIADMNVLMKTETLPEKISLTGILSKMDEVSTSNAGNAMRLMFLANGHGKYMQVVAFGRHVENILFKVGNVVILYFLMAQPGIKNSPGLLWLYDEGHAVLVRSGCMPGPDREEIVFGRQS